VVISRQTLPKIPSRQEIANSASRHVENSGISGFFLSFRKSLFK
jgi:hypothetical protein